MIQNNLKLLLILTVALLVTSCKEESSELIFVSPNGDNKVQITGSRLLSTDPFALSINASTGETDKGSTVADLYATELNDSTISINWIDNSSCNLFLKNWDQTVQTVPITFGNQ